MFIYRSLSSVGVGHGLVCKSGISRLLDIFDNGRHQPERIIRAGILQPVHNVVRVHCRDNRRRLKRLFLFLFCIRVKPFRREQMQSVAFGRESAQQFHDTLSAFLRIGVRYRHCILCRIPVPQTRAATYLDKRCKTRKHDIYFRLIEVPGIDERIHSLIRRLDLQLCKFIFPVVL